MRLRMGGMILSVLLCLIVLSHAAFALNATLGFFIITPFLGYIFIRDIVGNNRQFSASSASGTAVIVAVSCLAVQYLFILVTGRIDNNFIIGDSDSFVYHNIAAEIANNYKLSEIIMSFDVVQKTADRSGYVIPNIGMYWFLGILYAIVGVDGGPGTYLLVNFLCAIAIAYYSTLIASRFSYNGVSNSSAALFSMLIFLNNAISDHAFHLRKDFLLMALVTSALYYGIIRRWILFAVLTFFVLQLRFVLIVVFAIPVLYSLEKFTFKLAKISPKAVLRLLFVLILIIAFFPKSIFSQIGLASGTSDASVLYSLSVVLKGSSFFATNDLLQWIYIIFYPFPPLSLNAYLTSDGLVAMAIFVSNCYLLWWIFVVYRKTSFADDRYTLLISIWSVLFLLLLLNLVTAAISGLFGVVEPRYKFALWVLSGIIMMVYKNNTAKKFNYY